MPSPMTKAGVPLTSRALARMAFRAISASRAGSSVARKPFGIEADGAGDGEDVVEVEGTFRPQQRPVKRLVEAPRP